MNIFVGNLPFQATDADVRKLFEGFGSVLSAMIVMERQKKAPKSRGFGFVEMPDDEEASAAIAALNGKEFMGRAIDVNAARSKEEAEAARKLKLSKQLEIKALTQKQRLKKEIVPDKAWFTPVSRKPGTYKGGRRTNSYMKRKGLTGMPQEAKPRKDFRDNPMRWLKRKDQPKPRRKVESDARAWKKTRTEFKPWGKSGSGIKSWEGPAGDAKPFSESSGRMRKSEFSHLSRPGTGNNGRRSQAKARRNTDGYKRSS
ncbi:MAG: hypothetical protein V1869_06225 [Candidatus Omnitrophota bacterium]